MCHKIFDPLVIFYNNSRFLKGIVNVKEVNIIMKGTSYNSIYNFDAQLRRIFNNEFETKRLEKLNMHIELLPSSEGWMRTVMPLKPLFLKKIAGLQRRTHIRIHNGKHRDVIDHLNEDRMKSLCPDPTCKDFTVSTMKEPWGNRADEIKDHSTPEPSESVEPEDYFLMSTASSQANPNLHPWIRTKIFKNYHINY